MRGIRSKTPKQSDAAVPETPRKARKLEWPLLLYPASFVLALVALYFASQAIERQVPTTPAKETQEESTTSPGNSQSDPAVAAQRNAPDAGSRIEPNGELASSLAGSPRERNEETDRSAVSDRQPAAVNLDELEGSAKVVAMLRMAIDAKDHTQIKQCMEDLVALGDAAVDSLNGLVNAGGEAGLWAAEALARIGTPTAAGALLDTVAQTEDGQYKEDLGRRIAGIANHDSWPLLLDTMTQTDDATVSRASLAALSKMADTPVLDEIIARYEAAATEAEMEQLAQLVRNIQSSQATDALLSLAGDVRSTPQDSLQQAAIEALAKVGDTPSVSYLLQRLEASTPGEGMDVYSAITRINSPQAQSQLLYAAAGNKEVSAEYGRTAAIEALRNYPSQETCALLERIIAQDSNAKVVTAASRTLDEIQSAGDTMTANADSIERSEQALPLKSVMK